MLDKHGRWDAAYEWKAIALLSLAFGLVGLDRFIVGPLFPSIMHDLSLNYGQIGLLAGTLAIAWGIFAIVMGNVADRIGRRRVLLPSILAFSALAGLSGVATGFATFLILRAIMGIAEGAFSPASVASVADASRPSRIGFNQGLQFSLFALFGLGFGPIIATQLLNVVPSWRYVFFIVSLPGFVLAALMYVVIREPPAMPKTMVSERRWGEVLRSRNVIIAVLAVLSTMCTLFVIGAMMPSYLVDYLKLEPGKMGLVMSAIGFGGFLGQLVVPGLSDLLGRRIMSILAAVAGAILVKLFSWTGADVTLLFVLLFFIGLTSEGFLGTLIGPVATEAVSPALIATSIGLISGAGEIFGGGVAPAIGGWIAQNYGIQHVLDLAFYSMVLGGVLCLFLRESAPRFRKDRPDRHLPASDIDSARPAPVSVS